jgi:glycosyltransferase involved in cell wall biosynthesis
MSAWTILTCEYPPACGGVGDYTAQVAAELAKSGDEVTVFCPPMASAPLQLPGVEVVVLPDVYGPLGRRAIDSRLANRPSTILVQYVPTAFGLRGANLPWCRWLLRRARWKVRVMFHEPYFEFVRTPVRQNAVAAVQRVMARTLLRAADHVYLSTDAWRSYLTPYAPADAHPFVTLPIPSAIPRCDRPGEAAARRRALTGSPAKRLVGHFGTYGTHIAPMLRSALGMLLAAEPELSALCVGAGSDAFVRSLVDAAPALAGRVHATGRGAAPEIAIDLAACDLLLQPYPDGVTTRRTSVMAGLINGRAIVSTTGHLTEPVWTESGAVALAPAEDTRAFVQSSRELLSNHESRAALASRGERTYRERFALPHTIDALRGVLQGAAA